jgi:DNA-binding protein HU-beta
LNTKEFIKELAEKLDITQKEASKLLNSTTEVLSEVVAGGNSISIQKLGNFSVKKTESRKIYSPKLRKHVLTPPRKTLEFHPANSIKEKMKNIRTP